MEGDGRAPPRLRARALLGLITLAALAPGAHAAEFDPAGCTYPLGPGAERSPLPVLSEGDPEFAIVDGSFRHATKTVISVVPLWGTMHSVVDGRYRLSDGGNRHNIVYKAWGESGWNSTAYYPSNLDVTNSTPPGSALEPKAIAFQDKLWVAWESQGQPFSASPGSAVVFRSLDAAGNWSGVTEVSDPSWTSINRGIEMVVVGDQLLIAWLSMEGSTGAFEFTARGRFFDGTSFSPIVDISQARDGWGEFSLSLATDGTSVAASFISQNLSDVQPSFVPKFAMFDGSTWSDEYVLSPENRSQPTFATAEFYGGRLYFAFDSNDMALSRGGDFDIFLRTADAATLALGEITPMTAPENTGDDFHPEMAALAGKLFLAWHSSDDVLTLGDDLDLVLTVFNGTAWTAPVDFTRDEIFPNIDYIPHFMIAGDSLHLVWIDDVKPPGVTSKDQRIATRLVERGPRWWDGLVAVYEHEVAPRHGEQAVARIEVRDAAGARVNRTGLSVRFPDGSWQALESSVGPFAVTYTYNDSFVKPFTVLACGRPLALSAVDLPPDPVESAGPGFDALPIIAVFALSAAGRWRRRN